MMPQVYVHNMKLIIIISYTLSSRMTRHFASWVQNYKRLKLHFPFHWKSHSIQYYNNNKRLGTVTVDCNN